MNCFGCGAPVTSTTCAYCGTTSIGSSKSPLEIEITPALERLGLEGVAATIIGDGADLDVTTTRLEEQVKALWETGELKRADALIRVFSARLPRHDKLNLMLAKTSYLFGLSTIKDVSTSDIGQRYLKEARQYLELISDPNYQRSAGELMAKIAATEGKTITAFTVWDDDDAQTAAAKQSMESASGCGTAIGVIIAVVIGGLIILGMIVEAFG